MITSEIVENVEIGAPIGPGEVEETAFLAEQGTTSPPKPMPVVATAQDSATDAPIPPMDELIHRIPPAARELIDQLFRAKFITVKRMPVSAFKTQN